MPIRASAAVKSIWNGGRWRGFQSRNTPDSREGYYTSKLLNAPLDPTQPPVDYNGRPESFPKWSYGGDLSYSWNVGAFSLTAESNYSFHDTYSQFFLLGSNDFTIPKYWLANANLSLAPASGAPWTVTLVGPKYF